MLSTSVRPIIPSAAPRRAGTPQRAILAGKKFQQNV
jgi:hypothetical protein